jgi:hypothetical protein
LWQAAVCFTVPLFSPVASAAETPVIGEVCVRVV